MADLKSMWPRVKNYLIKNFPLFLPVAFLIYALLNHSWERVVAAGGIFGAYAALITVFAEYRPTTNKDKALHFFILAALALIVLNVGQKNISDTDCSKIAARIFEDFQINNNTLAYPGNIDQIVEGVSVGNFDETKLVQKFMQQQLQLLDTHIRDFCANSGKNEKEQAEITACTVQKAKNGIERSVIAFVQEAKRCLELSYDLNVYLEAPSGEKLRLIQEKYHISNATRVKDISQPNFPTSPDDGRFLSWFSDPDFYGYHTVKLIRGIANPNTRDMDQIELIKID